MRRLRFIWKYNRNRVAFWRLRWWLPVRETQRLATGSYEGTHTWWGPVHSWHCIDHNGRLNSGMAWR